MARRQAWRVQRDPRGHTSRANSRRRQRLRRLAAALARAMGTAELPIVGVLACRKVRASGSAYARVNDSVTRQLSQRAGVAVVLIPPADPNAARSTLQALDGLLLPGSGSFVHPARYSETMPAKP